MPAASFLMCSACTTKSADGVVAQLRIYKYDKCMTDGFGVCFHCAGAGKAPFYCIQCENIYQPTKAWRSAFHTHQDMGCAIYIVPCPEHSAKEEKPLFACRACGTTYHPSKGVITKRGLTYCNLHAAGLKPCAASFCRSMVQPGSAGVVGKTGYYYCADCYPVRRMPSNPPDNYHPMSWDFVPGCNCRICGHLAGKGAKWPKQTAAASVKKMCEICLWNSTAATGTVLGSQFYCHACQAQLTGTCAKCGSSCVKSDLKYAVGSDTWHHPYSWCKNCMTTAGYWLCDAQCRRWYLKKTKACPCDGIHPYNFSHPNPIFLHASNERNVDPALVPFLGMEIEVEAQVNKASRRAGAQMVREALSDIAYLVHDGSLLGTSKAHHTGMGMIGGEHGFEIVTFPFTYQWFEENWHRFEALMELLSSKGFRAWEGGRCGLHIHISRAPMSELHQMKFLRFIYGYPNLCMTIGQRDYKDPNLMKFAPFDVDDRSRFIHKIRDYWNPRHGSPTNKEHYTALNSNKPATHEGRWFRGSLNPPSVRKNVEFMHSVWCFTKQFGFRSSNEFNYINWLREAPQRRQYSTLLQYIDTHYLTRPWKELDR